MSEANEVDGVVMCDDVLITPSDWPCFGFDDCSSQCLASCFSDNPVLCLGCSKAANNYT